MGGCELRPALVGISRGFTRTGVTSLLRGWDQFIEIDRRKRRREFIQKRCVAWSRSWIYCYGITILVQCYIATDRLCDRLLKAKCLARSQQRWGQNSSGPGSCSYLEHSSSTDCAFSFVFDFRPVFCLLCRHRISFQPFGFGLKNKPLTGGYDLYSKSVRYRLPNPDLTSRQRRSV